MKIARPEKITPELAAALVSASPDERTLAVHIAVHSGSAHATVAGRYILAFNERAGETILGAEADGYSGYLSPAEVTALTAEVWVLDLRLIV